MTIVTNCGACGLWVDEKGFFSTLIHFYSRLLFDRLRANGAKGSGRTQDAGLGAKGDEGSGRTGGTGWVNEAKDCLTIWTTIHASQGNVRLCFTREGFANL